MALSYHILYINLFFVRITCNALDGWRCEDRFGNFCLWSTALELTVECSDKIQLHHFSINFLIQSCGMRPENFIPLNGDGIVNQFCWKRQMFFRRLCSMRFWHIVWVRIYKLQEKRLYIWIAKMVCLIWVYEWVIQHNKEMFSRNHKWSNSNSINVYTVHVCTMAINSVCSVYTNNNRVSCIVYWIWCDKSLCLMNVGVCQQNEF